MQRRKNYALVPVVMAMMVVRVISVVMPMMVVTIVMMVVPMMIIAVPSCGWSRAADCDCADNA